MREAGFDGKDGWMDGPREHMTDWEGTSSPREGKRREGSGTMACKSRMFRFIVSFVPPSVEKKVLAIPPVLA